MENAGMHALAVLRFVGRAPIERRRSLGVYGEMMGRAFVKLETTTNFILAATIEHTRISDPQIRRRSF